MTGVKCVECDANDEPQNQFTWEICCLDCMRSLKRQIENKSKEVGASEHRGNTVDYIYDKCQNYGNQLMACGNALREIRTLVKDVLTPNNTIACDVDRVAREALGIREGLEHEKR